MRTCSEHPPLSIPRNATGKDYILCTQFIFVVILGWWRRKNNRLVEAPSAARANTFKPTLSSGNTHSHTRSWRRSPESTEHGNWAYGYCKRPLTIKTNIVFARVRASLPPSNHAKLGTSYHWIPELYQRMKLPVFEGVLDALEKHSVQRKRRLEVAKTTPAKKGEWR